MSSRASERAAAAFRALPALAALLAPALLTLVVAWAYAGGYAELFVAIDRASALGPCRDGADVRPLCDFANHYFPQGVELARSPRVVSGFYYGGFFAVAMRVATFIDFATARWLWAALVVMAAATLLLAPALLGLGRSPAARLAYGTAFALALPLWHDLLFGQVSSLVSATVVLAFVAYRRDRPLLAAALLGIATSIKVYPALFALYFLLRRDRRAGLGFVATVVVASALLPLLVLGEHGLLAFYGSLWQGLRKLATFTAATPYSSNVVNAVAHLTTGRIDPASALYRGLTVAGLLVAGFHGWLAWRLGRDARDGGHAALMLGLATIPFVVRPCWVHYFVYLPLLGAYVLDGAAHSSRRWPRILVRASVGLSAGLVSVPALLLVGQARYYTSAMPFWATLCLLPGLYLAVVAEREPSVNADASSGAG